MLDGRLISLRPVREADLDRLYEAHTTISARGSFLPLGVRSESAFRRVSLLRTDPRPWHTAPAAG